MRRKLTHRKRNIRKSKKVHMKGGAPAFELPINKFYPLNMYNSDVSRMPIYGSERLMPAITGGRKKSRRRSQRGGGMNMSTLYNMRDPILGNQASLPITIGTTSGSTSLGYSLLGHSINTNPSIGQLDRMV